jgi:DNA-binding CsgD family transcriptional regulator
VGSVPETLTELLGRQQKALAEAARHARSLQSQLSTLDLRADPPAGGWRVREADVQEVGDMRQVMGVLEQVTAMARHQIRVLQPMVMYRELIEDRLGDGDAARGAGVSVRSVHRSSVLRNARAVDDLEGLERRGVQVRVAPVLPFGLFAVDEAFMLVRPPGRMLLIRQPTLIQSLGRVFEFCWDGARDLRSAQVADGIRPPAGEPDTTGPGAAVPALTEEQLVILRLWAKGRQDAAIARALQVSPRTLRRMVSALLRRLGVSSRFEAGLAVADILRPYDVRRPADRSS